MESLAGSGKAGAVSACGLHEKGAATWPEATQPAGSHESQRRRPSSADSRTTRASTGAASTASTSCRRGSVNCGEDDARSDEYTAAFKAACLRKYFSMMRAWRLLLDPKGNGRVSFSAFCAAARAVGFGEVRRLWTALDRDRSGFITLDEWDLAAFNTLMEFRQICYYHFGGLDCAFSRGMDRTRSLKASYADVVKFCGDYGFQGSVETLFRALDVQQEGYVTIDELDFLTHFEGERFSRGSTPLTARKPPKALDFAKQILPSIGLRKTRPSISTGPAALTTAELQVGSIPELASIASLACGLGRRGEPPEGGALLRWSSRK